MGKNRQDYTTNIGLLEEGTLLLDLTEAIGGQVDLTEAIGGQADLTEAIGGLADLTEAVGAQVDLPYLC